MAGKDLLLDSRDLATATFDSRSLLQALLRDLIERAAVAIQHRLSPCVLLIASNDAVCILRIDFHKARFASTPLATN
jgi:hypothetical protein